MNFFNWHKNIHSFKSGMLHLRGAFIVFLCCFSPPSYSQNDYFNDFLVSPSVSSTGEMAFSWNGPSMFNFNDGGFTVNKISVYRDGVLFKTYQYASQVRGSVHTLPEGSYRFVQVVGGSYGSPARAGGAFTRTVYGSVVFESAPVATQKAVKAFDVITKAFSYDELGRLTKVKDDTAGDREFKYDPVGNRTNVKAQTINVVVE